ncbi:BTB/POZ and MATH domain-containing protein 1 [Brachypodium distachyon]|uniref:MATH domain-containing protein n=1 Tax=Brachypodium distachyon TaxID=15368 RepID=I1IMZ3_BRADI|nr:BTB/POZ and MATH domain-containing protein 1 [Brachypodium distachyon]KQJ89162.1 hypothetical protein BRADI_4g23860v3 [Brachypodium distachyon]|eukprot:XP_010239263.1 BTB/POZ and MATH domain-containing protein 1 [Brachypodium distachyon]
MGSQLSSSRVKECRPIATSSTAAASEETRTHVMKIDGYSKLKQLFKSGHYTTSIPFSVGGHDWVVKYYPNSSRQAAGYVPGYMSLYLVLASAGAGDVRAKARFSLLDKDGEPVASCSHEVPEHTFRGKDSGWGVANFVKQEDLEGSAHLRGDSFRIRCDITVVAWIRSKETKGKKC